jgi:hypothetical protein
MEVLNQAIGPRDNHMSETSSIILRHEYYVTYTGPHCPAVWEVWLFSTGLPLEVVR